MVWFSRKKVVSFFMTLFLLMFLNGCKDDYESAIPYVYVNMAVIPTNYIEFNIPGGAYVFANAGYGGIIVFRDLVDSSNPFLAFDACCTHELSPSVRVEVKDDSGVATCPVCGSQFILFGGNGSPIKGPAAEPLKQYQTSYVGGRIMIRN
jgi:Rieske Fe-S protein